MNGLREKLNSVLYQSERPIEQRMFFMGSFVAVFVLMANIVISAVSHQGIPVIAALAGMAAVLAGVIVFVWRTNRFDIGGVVVSLVVGLVLFPLGYLFGGGAHSGTPTWFVICVAFMATIFRTGYFWVYVVVASVGFGIATYLSYAHPEIVTPLSSDTMVYIDTYVAAVATAVFVSLLLRYTTRIFNAESRLAHRQKEEIEALSKAQSTFFSSMSHEIRTPLNTIIGLNEMTLRDQQASEEVVENAANIQSASRMLLSLVNDVLDLSKIESGQMEIVEAQYETSRMLSDVVNLLWGRAKEKGLRFEVNVGDDIPSMLFGDEMRIKQVVINILTNAIKYTEEGGVTLTVGGQQGGPNEFSLRIDVEDTGIGIRREALPYLFDSFKRVDTERNRNVEGTGLGLAISKQLVDLMGGTISVDSIFTKGSHFCIHLPQRIVDASPMRYSSVAAHYEMGPYASSFEAPEAHVLIVDDNDMNRMVARKLLRATRVQVDAVSNGRDCLEKTAHTRYDVIFMDHEMPDMDGIQTLERVREQAGGLCRSTPVVALTANAGSDMNAFYLGKGFQAYLAKPIHGSLLEATLLQFLPPELVERAQAPAGEEEGLAVGATRHKKPLAITVDCPCDIPDEMLEEHNLVRMPIYIVTEQGRFRDVTEVDADNLFGYFEAGGQAHTAAASVEEYEAFFGQMLADAETLVHLSMSSKVSPAYEVACTAASSFGNVHVVDTRQFSSGLGLMALRAAELAREGKGALEIADDLEGYSDKVVSTVLVSSYDSPIIKLGMPAPLQAVMRMFSAEPMLHLRRNGLRLARFFGGYVSEASAQYVRSALRKARRTANKDLLFVTCSGCSLQEQQEIMDMVQKGAQDFERVVLVKASATVAANTWLHSFGIMYARK